MSEKGYWVARIRIDQPEGYFAYAKANGEAFAKYGARFLVRGGEFTSMEGEARERNAVIEFPSYEAALACYNSPEYAAAKALRHGAATIDLIVIKGYAGPQPSA